MDNETIPKIPAEGERKIFFDDPRFRMTVFGRMIIRIISWVFYVAFMVGTFLLLFSDMQRFRWIGVAFFIFLIDRVLHRGQGDIPVTEALRRKKINIVSVMRPEVLAAGERAFDRSVIARSSFSLELLKIILEDKRMRSALERLDIGVDEFRQKLDGLLKESSQKDGTSIESYQKNAEAVAVRSFERSQLAGHNFIELADCFAALADVEDEFSARLFATFSINSEDLVRALVLSWAAQAIRHLPQRLSGFSFGVHRGVSHRIMNRAWTARPTPILDRYGDDLTDLAREEQVGFLIGHEEEFKALVETLARPMNPNALLVGEAGIGKDTIVQHLAFLLTQDNVPEGLFDKRLVSLELQSLVVGAPPEELSKRLQAIVQEIAAAGNIIVYIPDIHNLVHTSGTAYLSAADALMPVIMSNAFPIVGTSYPREFKQLIEPRSDFVGVFEVIPVAEISESDAERVLAYESILLEREHKITISFGAIKRAVVLAKRYVRNKFLPASAEEILKSAVIDAQARGEKTLGPERVAAVTEAKVHIPLHEAGAAESEKLLHLEDHIHERLIGQDEAVSAVSEALREYRSGLSRKAGPIASFLFVGPTGVGKTELAKILASVQFGSENEMHRFDMTEYQDKPSFVRFIGSPDGTVRGALTEAVLEKPYSLILLDEFEKAYPDILNLFLQVFDDGRLTDGLGRTVDFTNTIIIATSNAHSDIINESLAKGESMTDIADYLKSKLSDVFKPELLNRFSKIVIFRNLAPDDLKKIVALNLAALGDLIKDKGMFLDVSPEAVEKIAKLGFDPQFGARPLRRVIDERLRAPLAKAILSKTIMRGARIRLILKDDDSFDFVME